MQKHAVSKVANGENGRRTLHHVQIVRNLYTFDIEPGWQGAKQIAIPEGFNANEWEIIGLLQDQQTGAIESAACTAIDGSVSS